MPSSTDLEMKFYGDLGYTGSLSDRRRAYWIATDTLNPLLSYNDVQKAFYANNAVEVAQSDVTELARRYFLGGSVKLTDANSIDDLHFDKFGGIP